MPTYDKSISRDSAGKALIPDAYVNSVLQEATYSSVVLQRAKNVRLSTKKTTQPVLATLPDAYWLQGDTGMKQTSDVTWKDLTITAEELAVIVPIPDAVIDDASINMWNSIKPLLAQAIGKKIDQAALFGADKPTSWPEGVVPAATAAGNVVQQAAGKDMGVAVAELGEKIAGQGYAVNGFVAAPGLQWKLVGLRDQQGTPIYTNGLAGSTPTGLYGYPLNECLNGSWNAAAAQLLAADWSKFIVGIRQDITYEIFREGVISDESGKVILNMIQQDMRAMRVVMRVGFQVAAPATSLAAGEAKRYPAGIITPAAA